LRGPAAVTLLSPRWCCWFLHHRAAWSTFEVSWQ